MTAQAACYEKTMPLTFATLCSGIDGFGVGFERAGMKCVYQCEINAACRKVLERHWPDIPKGADVNDESVADELVRLRPDVIAFGSPCQDLSVAGRRAGLAGQRSGLFFRCVELCFLCEARWVVFENVPGLMSSNEGKDLHIILDTFENFGYIVDIDILDAQFFGVPQRRRRVFIVCESRDSLLSKKTSSSAAIIAKCLIEILVLVLAGARSLSPTGCSLLGFGNGSPADLLSRRMRLFGMDTDVGWLTLLANLDAHALFCHREPKDLGLRTCTEKSAMPIAEDTASLDQQGQTESVKEFQNTGWLWSRILADFLPTTREFITSMDVSETTESTIFTCARMTMSIARYILHSTASCQPWLTAALCASTAMQEFTNYARQSTQSLFSEPRWVRVWANFYREAVELHESLGGSGNWGCPETLLPIAKGMRGDSPPSREAGARVAAGLTRGSASGGGVNAPGRRREDDVNIVAGTLQAHSQKHGHAMTTQQAAESGQLIPIAFGGNNTKGEIDVATACNAHGVTGRIDFENETFVAHTLRGEGFDASEDGTGRGTPLVPVAFRTSSNCGVMEQGDKTAALTTATDPTANIVAYQCQGSNVGPAGTLRRGNGNVTGGVPFVFAQNQRDEIRTMDVAGALASEPGMKQQSYVAAPFTFQTRIARNGRGRPDEVAPALTGSEAGETCDSRPCVSDGLAVRRLMPVECERLQGFPDDHTRFGPNGEELSDSARYRMCGNAVVVPVAEYIARRIVAGQANEHNPAPSN